MAKAAAFVGGLVCGLALGTLLVVSHADEASAEVQEAAIAAHVDPVDLEGALNSLKSAGLPQTDPYTYLRSTGELPPITRPPAPVTASPTGVPAMSARAQCIIAHESENNPRAVNARSGAAGLGQFLASTWNTTPQGRAGLSRFDPVANRAAVQFMLDAGRAREFSVVTSGLC